MTDLDAAASVEPDMPAIDPPYPSAAYGWYVAIILVLIYTSSFIDRSMLSLMVGPIRADLGLSDFQLSLLQGFAFAAFYTAMGLPLGRLADRSKRNRMVAIGVTVWSVATATCGLARSFTQLFLSRIGVGIGEATLGPAAYSMISDSVPRRRLAGAFSVYNVGIPLGTGLALVIGGTVINMMKAGGDAVVPVLGALKAWQIAFIVAGAPGLILAVLMLTVREPTRRGMISNAKTLSLRDSFAYLARHRRTYLCIYIGCALYGIVTFGYSQWIPTALARNFAWNLGEVGQTYGAIVLSCGTVGVLLAGWVANRAVKAGRPDAAFRILILIGAALWPFLIVAPLVGDRRLALAAFGAVAFLMNAWPGCAATALQSITPNQLRGQVTAIYFFIGSTISFGAGPTLVAMITQYGFGYDNALKYALVIVGGIAMPLAVLSLCLGAGAYRRTLAATAQWIDRIETSP
jgi:MFS family permease